jgi:NNP family nitrate/nitrite transporter-like MFS transporter
MTKRRGHNKYAALAVATGLLIVNFWAWSLISPLATTYAKQFSLSPVSVSMLVAAPVLIGSLARIPFGLLTDRYGGRRLFAVICFLSSLATAGLAEAHSHSALLAAAFGVGIAGASFAVGIPFVNAWFPKNERGLALGIYALGNAGTAVSGLLTPRIANSLGSGRLFIIISAVLLAMALAMAAKGRDAPSWKPAKAPAISRLKQAAGWEYTWKLAMIYAVTFGAFVAFGLYLPVLLNQSYGLDKTDAAARAAGFVLLATLIRPLGGWLSDRLNGIIVLRLVFLSIFILAGLAAKTPSLTYFGTAVYLGLAAALGTGNGAVFAIIGHRCDAKLVGTVTGLVGAAGGLGGYFPPLVMGASWQLSHSYSASLFMLAAVSLIIFIFSRRLLGVSKAY